jgi:hypothetical protein
LVDPFAQQHPAALRRGVELTEDDKVAYRHNLVRLGRC